MKRLPLVLILGFVCLFWPDKVNTEGVKEVLAQRTMRSDGDSRIQWSVSVSSTSPISPFASVSFTDGNNSQLREMRKTGFVNQTSYYIHIGTWASFTAGQAFWTVDRSSLSIIGSPNTRSTGLASYETLNHATFYLRLEVEAATQTVRGFIELD